FKRQVANIYPIQQNLSTVNVIKTHQKINNGGFSGAGGSYDGNGFAGIGLKRDVFKHFLFLIIAKGNLIEGNSSLGITDVPGVLRIRIFVFSIQYVYNILEYYKRSLYGI